jgi:hypothetical protein
VLSDWHGFVCLREGADMLRVSFSSTFSARNRSLSQHLTKYNPFGKCAISN